MSLKRHVTRVARDTATAVARAICNARYQEIVQNTTVGLKPVIKQNGNQLTINNQPQGEATVSNVGGRAVGKDGFVITDGKPGSFAL